MCAKLKLGVLGSGSGSNMQSIQDAILAAFSQGICYKNF